VKQTVFINLNNSMVLKELWDKRAAGNFRKKEAQ
jgi:hypothetical protein